MIKFLVKHDRIYERRLIQFPKVLARSNAQPLLSKIMLSWQTWHHLQSLQIALNCKWPKTSTSRDLLLTLEPIDLKSLKAMSSRHFPLQFHCVRINAEILGQQTFPINIFAIRKGVWKRKQTQICECVMEISIGSWISFRHQRELNLSL